MAEEHWQELTIEIRLTGENWQEAGIIELRGKEELGTNAPTEFRYDLDYASENLSAIHCRAVSSSLPVTTEPVEFDTWPPFLLDLFPQGAALKHIVDHYRIPDQQANYWKILKRGRISPPGNLRVRFDRDEGPIQERTPGFSRAEVLENKADFLEYMIQQGAPVSGTTGPGGASPKFILREDDSGRFHADGVLPDAQTRKCWLIKFPRGRTGRDRDILKCEESFMRIAGQVGLATHESEIEWESDCLFVPRFDREISGGAVGYLGMESFYSLVGEAGFGSRLWHETYVRAIRDFSSFPENDILEYIMRDFLSIMMGNTDNHGRNQSLLKSDEWSKLAPLYDFAPMKADPEGIARNSRWSFEDSPEFVSRLKDYLSEQCNIDGRSFKEKLHSFYDRTKSLEALMRDYRVPSDIISIARPERDRLLSQIKSFLGSSV